MKFRINAKQNYLMKNFPSYGAGNSTLKPKYVVIHDTAGQSSALQESKRLFNNPNQFNNGITHYYTDDKETYQLILDNIKAYHCGDGMNLPGNGQSLGIEVCKSLPGGKFTSEEQKKVYEKALDNAYKVAADLCEQYGLDPNKAIRQHREFYNTSCPYTQKVLFGSYEKALANAKKKVSEYLGKKPVPKPPTATNWKKIDGKEADKLTSPLKVGGKVGDKSNRFKVSNKYINSNNTVAYPTRKINNNDIVPYKSNQGEYEGNLIKTEDGTIWGELDKKYLLENRRGFIDLGKNKKLYKDVDLWIK